MLAMLAGQHPNVVQAALADLNELATTMFVADPAVDIIVYLILCP